MNIYICRLIKPTTSLKMDSCALPIPIVHTCTPRWRGRDSRCPRRSSCVNAPEYKVHVSYHKPYGIYTVFPCFFPRLSTHAVSTRLSPPASYTKMQRIERECRARQLPFQRNGYSPLLSPPSRFLREKHMNGLPLRERLEYGNNLLWVRNFLASRLHVTLTHHATP